MSRQLNPPQVWSQVPVANRLIEVNTKTGFSLTAGSYSVRASNSQTLYSAIGAGTTVSPSHSSVTVTRCQMSMQGHRTLGTAFSTTCIAQTGFAATTTSWNLNATGSVDFAYGIQELF